MKKILPLAMLFAWPFFAFSQNYIYVSPDGDGNGSIGDPTSLIEAINMALDNDQEDVIYLQQGIYPNTSLVLDYNDPATDPEPITLSGGWDESFNTNTPDPFLTTLNAGAGRIITILNDNSTVNGMVKLYNMTLTDASINNEHGAGVGVIGSTQSTGSVLLEIELVRFYANSANGSGLGGAIYTRSGLTISDCIFDNNTSSNGGAIFISSYENTEGEERNILSSTFVNNTNFGNQGSTIYTAAPELFIQDCTIKGMEDGSSSGPGSSIWCNTNSYTIIDRCKFEDIKIDYWGSAVQAWNSDVDIANSIFSNCNSGLNNGFGTVAYYHNNGAEDRTITIANCTFAGNQSQNGSFASAVHFRGNGQDAIYIANSIFWDMGANSLYKESGSAFLTNSVSDGDAPGFTINPPLLNSDPLLNENYEISSDSPAIDAGDEEYIDENWLDISGGYRHLGEHPDIGAHEYNAPPLDVLLPVAELTENNDANYNFTNISTLGQIGDTHLFELIDGNGTNDADNGKFSISDEQLFINESANYEDQDTYFIFIRATDSEGQAVETALMVAVIDINEAPEFIGSLDDQNGVVGEFNSFTINTDAFEDEDEGDDLSFAASLSNGDPLPEWLTYDTEDNSLSGTPVQEEILEIMITATDQGDLEASGTFLYNISLLGLENIERQSINLYPNPATDFIRIEIPEFHCNFAIYSADGKLMNEGVMQGNQKNLEVSTLPTGHYILIVWDEEVIRTGKFLKE